jgi:hypothetical protein
MSRIPRFIGVFAVTAAAALLLTACPGDADDKPAQSNHDQKLSSLGNDLDGRTLTVPHAIQADDLTVTTTFSTEYNTKDWQITSNKTLNIQLTVTPGASAGKTQVLVEHMHADVSILADNETLNGWVQDSMDSSIHGGTQPGFEVSQAHPYSMAFSIEGLSQTMIDGWGYAVGEYGAMEISEKRLTETNLRDKGKAKGNKIVVVWVLLIKSEGTQNYHEISITDEFTVPVG